MVSIYIIQMFLVLIEMHQHNKLKKLIESLLKSIIQIKILILKLNKNLFKLKRNKLIYEVHIKLLLMMIKEDNMIHNQVELEVAMVLIKTLLINLMTIYSKIKAEHIIHLIRLEALVVEKDKTL